jgi:hypothetical protein
MMMTLSHFRRLPLQSHRTVTETFLDLIVVVAAALVVESSLPLLLPPSASSPTSSPSSSGTYQHLSYTADKRRSPSIQIQAENSE